MTPLLAAAKYVCLVRESNTRARYELGASQAHAKGYLDSFALDLGSWSRSKGLPIELHGQVSGEQIRPAFLLTLQLLISYSKKHVVNPLLSDLWGGYIPNVMRYVNILMEKILMCLHKEIGKSD